MLLGWPRAPIKTTFFQTEHKEGGGPILIAPAQGRENGLTNGGSKQYYPAPHLGRPGCSAISLLLLAVIQKNLLSVEFSGLSENSTFDNKTYFAGHTWGLVSTY